MALRTTVARQLCKRSIDVDARIDSMDAVRTYVEYGWSLNPEIDLKTTESRANNSIGIDGIDVQPAIVLFQPAWQAPEGNHIGSAQERLGLGIGVVVVIVKIWPFAEARV